MDNYRNVKKIHYVNNIFLNDISNKNFIKIFKLIFLKSNLGNGERFHLKIGDKYEYIK